MRSLQGLATLGGLASLALLVCVDPTAAVSVRNRRLLGEPALPARAWIPFGLTEGFSLP